MRASALAAVVLLAACSSGTPKALESSPGPSLTATASPTPSATRAAPPGGKATPAASVARGTPTRSPKPSPAASRAAAPTPRRTVPTSPKPSAKPSPTPRPAPTRAAKTWLLTIQSFEYSPDKPTIRVGDSIRVTNKDSATHTFTAQNGAFDSGDLDQNQSKTLTFRTKGTFDFVCDLHDSMTGTLTVTA